MRVLPLQFSDGESVQSLGLTGLETFTLQPVTEPGQSMTVTIRTENGGERTFTAVVRIDTPVELDYYLDGGILQNVLRRMAAPKGEAG